jgi:hypothetical protein
VNYEGLAIQSLLKVQSDPFGNNREYRLMETK